MSINEYKVVFRNNKPVSAYRQQFIDYHQLIQLSTQGEKKLINWLIVPGKDEEDALLSAAHIIHTYWEHYLNGPSH